MKRDKNIIGLRRFSASPKSNLPPITPHSYTYSEIGGLHPYAAYSTLKDQEKNTGQRFFIAKHPGTAQSPNTDISTHRSMVTSQDFYTPSKSLDHSDITERVESYELRIKKVFTLEALEENLTLWEKCLEDIMPQVKKHESDMRQGLVQICTHFLENSKNLLKYTASQQLADQAIKDELKNKISKLQIEKKKCLDDIETYKTYKKIEMKQIEKELEEIFGKNEIEIHSLRVRVKEMRDNYSKGTVDFLMEIWNSMNQDFQIPEIKNGDFTGLDPSEIPSMLSKKFRLLQKFTAKKITDIIKTRKNAKEQETQTITEFIDPKAYEDQAKNIEKLQYQLNSAFISIDKYRENFGSKINILESLENEKNTLVIEVGRMKKETEVMSTAISKANYENKKIQSELDSVKKEKEHLQKDKAVFHSEIIEHGKVLQEYKSNAEKLEKTVKEKDEKIIFLEKQLAKRRGGKIDKQDEPSGQMVVPVKPQQKFDEKAFMDSIRYSNNRKRGSTDMSQNPGNKPGESVSYDSSGNPIYNASVSSSSHEQVGKTVKTSSRANSPQKGKGSRRLGLIEETDSPNYLGNYDKNLDINTSNTGAGGRFSKSRERGTHTDESTENSTSKGARRSRIKGGGQGEKDLKNGKKRQANGPNSMDAENYVHGSELESGDEYGVDVRHEDYLDQDDYDGDSQMSYEGRGRSAYMSTKSTSTDEFSHIKCIEYSKGFQFNGMIPDNNEEETKNNGVHVLPYNPNQYYGLRGDSYYHTKNSVFAAQPRIPDIKDSFTFQQPYHIKK